MTSAKSLFGGPLSTRDACVNYDALLRMRQQQEAEAAACRARRERSLQAGGTSTSGRDPTRSTAPVRQPSPPPPPEVLRKEKIKQDLDVFDDLDEGGGVGGRDKAGKQARHTPGAANGASKLSQAGGAAPSSAHRPASSKQSPAHPTQKPWPNAGASTGSQRGAAEGARPASSVGLSSGNRPGGAKGGQQVSPASAPPSRATPPAARAAGTRLPSQPVMPSSSAGQLGKPPGSIANNTVAHPSGQRHSGVKNGRQLPVSSGGKLLGGSVAGRVSAQPSRPGGGGGAGPVANGHTKPLPKSSSNRTRPPPPVQPAKRPMPTAMGGTGPGGALAQRPGGAAAVSVQQQQAQRGRPAPLVRPGLGLPHHLQQQRRPVIVRKDSLDRYEDDFVVDDEDEMEEEEVWRREMRRLTGYDPSRYRSRDLDDDRAMVAGWQDMQAEERRSERLGRAEDEQAEEEERLRVLAKKKKLQQLKKQRVQ